MRIIAALIGAMLLYELQRILYSRFWNKNLTVELCLSDDMAVEGDSLSLIETITNQKLLPIPVLKIKYMVSKYLIFLDTRQTELTDHTYRNDLFSLMMYQKLTRNIPFLCTKRGYYTIDKITLVCNDILLESELVAGAETKLQLYVYPRPIEYSQLQIPFQNLFGSVLTKRLLYEDPFEFKSIREYQSFDTMKTINWKASAKSGCLMVNVHDHTASQQIKILLNLESDTLRKHEELIEESIRLAATFAAYFIEQGIPTALYTNALAVISREVLSAPAGSGYSHIRTINETLARIDDTLTPPSFLRVIGEDLKSFHQNDFILLISSYQRMDLQHTMSDLSRNKTNFTWIVPVSKEVELTVEGDLLKYAIPWTI
ncbi:MAG: hypothetical protein K0R34_1601 [Herbinix sp.]|jgi:uncharacterized protein (DUF58 family)|nr:hypothetical protein [Herbinix sp.]